MIEIAPLLKRFIAQAKTDNLKTSTFPKFIEEIKIKVSFGQGFPARIPWISFTIEPNTTSNGIYPVYLYYKSIEKLILAYGISESNKPLSEWDIENPLKIADFFDENGYEPPQRYGNSFFYRSYNIDDLDSAFISDDLNEIIKSYRTTIIKNTRKTTSSDLDSVFKLSLVNSGLNFSSNLTNRFISSLLTKPFVILTGLSGSGKTKLAQAFAMWMSESKEQYALVPVGADWTNREPLLGYPNSLKPQHFVKPDSGVLDILLSAHRNFTENNGDLSLCKPYFLILDEMNLSHVERYFADFLSAMESGDEIKLYTGSDRYDNLDEQGAPISGDKPIPNAIILPKNLFIIGTVNIDETTYMFSPKVLDRANTIEFRISKDEMAKFLEKHEPLNMENLLEDIPNNIGKGVSQTAAFMELAARKDIKIERQLHQETFVSFFTHLQLAGTEFGYRTANEMTELVSFLNHFSVDMEEAYDIAIMQKLLPKLNGSRSKLSKVLPNLGGLYLTSGKKEDAEKIFQEFKGDSGVLKKHSSEVKFKLSFEKICRMYKNAHDNGFASYAEA